MIEKVKDLVKEDSFEMNIREDSIYIKNYRRLISLEETYISIATKEKIIKMEGEKLTPKKIVETELLITGNIKKIEVQHAG